MYPDSGSARNSTTRATSFGSPRRPTGIRVTILSIAAGGSAVVIGGVIWAGVAGGQHVLQDGPRQVERAGQVDADDAVPLLGAHLPHGLVQRDAGVVDQDVQLAVPVQDLADDPFTVLVAAHVALVDADGVVGVLVGELLRRVGVGRVARRDLDPAV